MITVREGRKTTMMNWYENAEIHAEDYEELLELLAEDAEG